MSSINEGDYTTKAVKYENTMIFLLIYRKHSIGRSKEEISIQCILMDLFLVHLDSFAKYITTIFQGLKSIFCHVKSIFPAFGKLRH